MTVTKEVQMNKDAITVEDVLKYVEYLSDCVEKQLNEKQDVNTQRILLQLKTLLAANHVKKVIDGLGKHQVNITAFHKIEEIDNLLDEMYLKDMNLPYPNEYFLKESRKQERARRISLLILILGLFGFEWVVE